MYKFTTLLWDVDGTLLDFLYSQRIAISKCFKTIGREITDEQIRRYSEINDDWWKRLELGQVTKEQLLTGRFTTLFDECGIAGVDVEAFQQEFGLPVTGTVGVLTWDAIATLYSDLRTGNSQRLGQYPGTQLSMEEDGQ